MHNALLCPARKPAFCGKVCIPLPALRLRGQLQIPLPSAHCVRSHLPPRGRLNSLSQSLTALTAPSEREPLAYPQTLCPNRKLYRHAKGPILEDDFPRSGGRCRAATKRGIRRRRRLGEYPQMPSRENEIAERPQTLRYLEIKIIFPLIMPKAHAAGIPNRPLLLRHGLQHRLLQVGDRDGAQRLQVGIRAVCGEFANLHGVFAFQVAAPACAVLVPLLA